MYGVRGQNLINNRSKRPFALEQPSQFGRKSICGALAAQDVERAVTRRRHEPGRGIIGRAAHTPHFQGAAKSVLHHIFRQREVVNAEYPRQCGNQASRLVPEEMLVDVH